MLKQIHLFLLFFLLAFFGCKNDSGQTMSVVPTPNLTQSEDDTAKTKDERMSWQKPVEVIQSLGNIEDKVIADIGAGIGYFSFKLVPKSKKVIAIDIDPETIQILEAFKTSLSKDLQSNFDVRLATPTDSKLKPNEVDIIFIVNTIAYITPRVQYLKDIKKALKPDGQIFIVDFKSKRMPDFIHAPPVDQRLYVNILEDQLEAAGYTNIVTDDTQLDYQYMVKANN